MVFRDSLCFWKYFSSFLCYFTNRNIDKTLKYFAKNSSAGRLYVEKSIFLALRITEKYKKFYWPPSGLRKADFAQPALFRRPIDCPPNPFGSFPRIAERRLAPGRRFHPPDALVAALSIPLFKPSSQPPLRLSRCRYHFTFFPLFSDISLVSISLTDPSLSSHKLFHIIKVRISIIMFENKSQHWHSVILKRHNVVKKNVHAQISENQTKFNRI